MDIQIWTHSLVSVFIVSLISFVGAFGLALKEERLRKILIYLISFSAGALLGDVFLHILPEMSETAFGAKEGFYVLFGIVLFAMLEGVVWWHHSHTEHKEEIHSMVYLSQAGDTLHNFMDGIIIAAAYFISLPVGIATTFAVIFHEIPQELGNFAVLIHGGWKVKKALLYNFLSALASVLGALLVLVFLGKTAEVPSWLVAFSASSFIYLAMSDLLPEIQKQRENKNSFLLLLFFVLGMSAMGLILLLE